MTRDRFNELCSQLEHIIVELDAPMRERFGDDMCNNPHGTVGEATSGLWGALNVLDVYKRYIKFEGE